MKRVEAININGIVFSIDDDAYAKLSIYLDALSSYFEDEQGGREIIADIEARIAELFAERSGGTGQVVNIADVAQVIETLGTPEDIAGADSDTNMEETSPRPRQAEKPTHRLYRDPDHRYLGGVCAGISAWLGINPAILRLVFILATFFYGSSVVVYCILWIIIPIAKTTAQKLEMRGEPVTISNIEKNIKESFSDPSLKQSFRNFLNEAGEFVGKVIGFIGRFIGVIVGLFLFFTGICCTILFVSLIFVQDIAFNHWVEWDFLSFNELFRHIISPGSYTLLFICSVIVGALIIFALFFWGIKLIAGFQVKHKMLHVALSILWVIAIVAGVVVCFLEARNYAWRNEQLVEIKQIAPADTLFLAAIPSQMKISNNPMDVYYDKTNGCFYGKPNLHVRRSDDGQIKLRLNKEAQGKSRMDAYQYAENIEYNVVVQDSLLTFPPHFKVVPQDKWKFQTLDMVLYVPEGTVIVADETLCTDRALGRWFRWNFSTYCAWIMTNDEGLEPTSRER